MEQGLSSEASNHSVEKFPALYGTHWFISVLTTAHQYRGPVWYIVTRYFFTVRSYSPSPTPQARGPPLVRLPATAYSTYSQLPSTPRGRLLHPQPEEWPYRGNWDLHNMDQYLHNKHNCSRHNSSSNINTATSRGLLGCVVVYLLLWYENTPTKRWR
jgi:hypothetical protein